MVDLHIIKKFVLQIQHIANEWNPLWGIRNMLLGIASIWMDDKEQNGISHIHESPAQRKVHAKASMEYNLTHYKNIVVKFDQFIREDGTVIRRRTSKCPCQKRKPKGELKEEPKVEVKKEPKVEVKEEPKVEVRTKSRSKRRTKS